MVEVLLRVFSFLASRAYIGRHLDVWQLTGGGDVDCTSKSSFLTNENTHVARKRRCQRHAWLDRRRFYRRNRHKGPNSRRDGTVCQQGVEVKNQVLSCNMIRWLTWLFTPPFKIVLTIIVDAT